MISVSVNVNLSTEQLRGATTEGIVRGLNMGAERLRAISVPLTPIDRGDLRSATEVIPAEPGNEVATVSNGMIYAARQHEELDWRHEDGQAKYLEQPARENADELMEIVAAQIRRSTRS